MSTPSVNAAKKPVSVKKTILRVLLYFVVNEQLARTRRAHDLMLKLLIALVCASVTYSLLLCLVPETGWYSNVYPWAYQDLLQTALFWK